MIKKLTFFILLFFVNISLFAQVDQQTQKYRDEPYGDKTFRKKGIMDGNLVRTIFRNDGQIGNWVSKWLSGAFRRMAKGNRA